MQPHALQVFVSMPVSVKKTVWKRCQVSGLARGAAISMQRSIAGSAPWLLINPVSIPIGRIAANTKPLRPRGRSGLVSALVLRRINQNVPLARARSWWQGLALNTSDLIAGLGVLVLTRFGCRGARLQRFAHGKSPINEQLVHRGRFPMMFDCPCGLAKNQ